MQHPVARTKVTIGIPTYRRVLEVSRLLNHLAPQVHEAAAVADVEVVIVDNEPSDETARAVTEVAGRTGLALTYRQEPVAGIPAARNVCVREAHGSDALIFLDDDEWPADGWLDSLLRTWLDTGADIVLGPARGVLPDGAPRWAARSGVFNKDRGLRTGSVIRTAYSYNTLVSARVLSRLGPTFDHAFRDIGSSDRHYFTQARLAGFQSVWCADALVYEEIPRSRLRLRWLLRRGLRTGGGAAKSIRMLYPRMQAGVRILALIWFNLLYGLAQVVGTALPRWHWAEGLRRLGIGAGLAAGAGGYVYAEYRARRVDRGESPAPSPQRVARSQRVLFLATNGAGTGHLTRLVAMARRASPEIQPVFLSLSHATQLLRWAGLPFEVLGAAGYPDSKPGDWDRLLVERLEALIAIHRPAALVFDGIYPYPGIRSAAARHGAVAFVWSRRGLWRPEVEHFSLEWEAFFDAVLEPGDLAAQYDRGPTATRPTRARRVGPVMVVGRDELLDRDKARADLGIDSAAPTALVQLGAGNIDDVSTALGAAVEALRDAGFEIRVAQSAISRDQARVPEWVKSFTVYPLARYLPAFDVAVTAAGYNTFHELVAAGVPSVFVPNLRTQTDDQSARARWAAEVGVGRSAVEPSDIAAAIGVLASPQEREEMRSKALSVPVPDGAAEAMAAVELIAGVGPDSA